MEFAQTYINKYASATFNVNSSDALTHQFNDLFKQCQDHNEALKSKKSSKKGKKERLSNILSMLCRMREIAEQKELQWYTERAQIREDLDKFEKSLTVAAASSAECECEELREEVERLTDVNCELEEKIDRWQEICVIREQQISSLESKEVCNEEQIVSLT
ncbi:hypothetical protein GDO86_008484 [Hymenochirus boettgeri]|uniref:Uncharacterized protein n=1 Tax=Hymenochirus boettgeri TaxID=247094 RepID=A0A8T2J0L2_9PIPI|nr:hypothetical protein GDO86_008484 [Hymenochirus boettgeri]